MGMVHVNRLIHADIFSVFLFRLVGDVENFGQLFRGTHHNSLCRKRIVFFKVSPLPVCDEQIRRDVEFINLLSNSRTLHIESVMESSQVDKERLDGSFWRNRTKKLRRLVEESGSWAILYLGIHWRYFERVSLDEGNGVDFLLK